MGAWGTELFESDAACDVRDAFHTLIPHGTSVESAVGYIVGQHLSGQKASSGEGNWNSDEGNRMKSDEIKRDWLTHEADPETVIVLAWCVQD